MRPGRATTSAFRSNQERVLCDAPTGRAARRLQSLINCDSGGRAYDIISNHRKPLRLTIGEAHATRMMHPSNLSPPRGAGTAPTRRPRARRAQGRVEAALPHSLALEDVLKRRTPRGPTQAGTSGKRWDPYR